MLFEVSTTGDVAELNAALRMTYEYDVGGWFQRVLSANTRDAVIGQRSNKRTLCHC